MTEELAARLGLALAIGLLVGLERGWRERDAPDRSRTAGIRTYGISGLAGGLFALLSASLGSIAILVSGFLVFACVLTIYMLREAIADDDYSATGAIAGLAVFALGALAVSGDHVLAAGGGAALAAVLASRDVLHEFLKRLSWEELRAALILAVMTAIILPLLPDRTVDPWNGVNPHEIWLFTILVAALSYAGYIAARLFGETRGLIVNALFGAIVSSTAVTVALARRAADAPSGLAGAAALAAAVSITRVCIVVGIAAPAILPHILAPALAAALVFVAIAGVLLFRMHAAATNSIAVKNPFELAPLLGFAAGFAVIASASAYLTTVMGAAGMLATSAVSGLFDVDVAVLSAVRQQGAQAGATLEPSAVADAVLVALAANAAGRALLAAAAGGWRFSIRYIGASIAAVLAGVVVNLMRQGA